ncbi:MAG: hypothetical protein V1824_03825, partial [archaeon]
MTPEKHKDYNEWVIKFQKEFDDGSLVSSEFYQLLRDGRSHYKNNLVLNEKLLISTNYILKNFKHMGQSDDPELKDLIKELKQNILLDNNFSTYYCVQRIS